MALFNSYGQTREPREDGGEKEGRGDEIKEAITGKKKTKASQIWS